MNIKYFLMGLAVLGTSPLIPAGPSKKKQAVTQTEFTPCYCYCSDVCNLRESRPDDKPFVDPETGLCFCKQRDQDNYLEHGCHVLPKPDPSIRPCCHKNPTPVQASKKVVGTKKVVRKPNVKTKEYRTLRVEEDNFL